MDNNNTSNKNRNIIYIIIITVIVAILVLSIRAFLKDAQMDDIKDQEANLSTVAPAAFNVKTISGDEEATLKDDVDNSIPEISLKIGENSAKIMEFEKKNENTIDLDKDYKPSTSTDGYSYYTYKYYVDKVGTYFDTRTMAADDMSQITYVTKDDKLIEIRISMGGIGNDKKVSMIQNIKKKLGDPTYEFEMENGSTITRWKTNTTTLEVNSDGTNVTLSYRMN